MGAVEWNGWRNYAACEGVDSDIFLMDKRKAEADIYCNDCLVMKFCERYATNTRSVGTWGGTTYSHRLNNTNPANPIAFRLT